MSDTAKASILAAGTTIAAGLAGVMLRPLSLFLLGIVTGPGLLVAGLLGRFIHHAFLLWLIGAIPQFFIVYAVALISHRRPLLWPLRMGILLLIWVGAGYVGWVMVR
jgi:hypothetical protein